MASSSQSAPLSLDPFRDQAGFLPLIQCSKCGTLLVGRVSQKVGIKGKKLYKCPLFENTNYACRTKYYEEHYVELLVGKGILPRGCSQIQGGVNARDTIEASLGVEACQDLLEIVVARLKDLEGVLKVIADGQQKLLKNVDKTGERLTVVAVAILFVLVLVLLVLLVK